MSKITVVTITYNRPELLPRTIECVLGQSFSDFEYIIVNNGSTDKQTSSIIDQYTKLDDRISSYSYQKNLMITDESWFSQILHKGNLGDPECHYCFTIDDDDFMEKDTLQILYKMAIDTGSDIVGVGSKYVQIDGTMNDKFVFDGIYTFDRLDGMMELLKRRYFNSSRGGKLYHKKVLDFEIVPGVRNRDIYREYRVMNNINHITVSGEPQYYFYRHEANLSGLDRAGNITHSKMQEHLQANAIRTEWLKYHMPEIKEFAHYCEASFMISLWHRIYSLKVQECYDIAENMRKWLQSNLICLKQYHWYTNIELEILKNMGISF